MPINYNLWQSKLNNIFSMLLSELFISDLTLIILLLSNNKNKHVTLNQTKLNCAQSIRKYRRFSCNLCTN